MALSNSSKTPTREAPEVTLLVPTSFRPILPTVRSPPELMVRFTTSVTVPAEISIPLMVSSVLADTVEAKVAAPAVVIEAFAPPTVSEAPVTSRPEEVSTLPVKVTWPEPA